MGSSSGTVIRGVFNDIVFQDVIQQLMQRAPSLIHLERELEAWTVSEYISDIGKKRNVVVHNDHGRQLKYLISNSSSKIPK